MCTVCKSKYARNMNSQHFSCFKYEGHSQNSDSYFLLSQMTSEVNIGDTQPSSNYPVNLVGVWQIAAVEQSDKLRLT